ncbi:uncharacterized protein ACHE_20830A [Aspergillus chevalieri]|uniref:V-SNARE n=1 Tax=Aspergillus chevalieri TaxID=182096 RepID=A0A7R7VJ75_ASPCH|nr:uncharacterized protein ACHE_20830A [Aspergillus chevalieri]BCR85372.1 hypothetical protein ACHE_20830A [Aspergillus chevalieri]
MSHIPDKRKPSSSIPGDTPYKRSRVSYADDDNEEYASQSPAAMTHERPRNNPLYGQKSAFPGLDVDAEGELFYGPAEDGLEYLRMVRSEANSLPLLFTAPKTQTTETQTIQTEQTTTEEQVNDTCEESTHHEDHEGTYVDGVFVARSTPAALPTSPPSVYPEAQQSYYTLLHHRFLLLRSILKCTPPPTSIPLLDDSHPISLPRHSKIARKEWRSLLLSVDPQTVQLACMDMESVLGVLGIMARLMSENVRSGDIVRIRRIGAWAWGLLGKCREVGQLGTEEVGEIRDLGKRAVKILGKMREDERAVQEEDQESVDDEDQDEEHVGEQIEETETADSEQAASAESEAPDHDMKDAGAENTTDELEAAKARLQAKIQGNVDEDCQVQTHSDTEENPGEVAMQTRAMLDMIITVVGEYYGQRDLLEAREIWQSIQIPKQAYH